MIDQRDYQLLRTVLEQGSVQRAASAIGVSWPSVSKRLGKIEDKLNIQLFERRRGRSGVVPLPVLQRLLSEYEDFAANLTRSIVEESSSSPSMASEIIKLGIATTIGKTAIERSLAILSRLGAVVVSDMSADDALKQVEEGELDLCLTAEPSYDTLFKAYLIGVDPFQVAFPAGHRFESQNSVQLQDLDDERYVNRVLCEFPRYYQAQTGEELSDDEDDDGPHSISNEVVAQVVIQQGYGVAIIPESLIVYQSLKRRALVRPSIYRKIMLVSRADSRMNEILKSTGDAHLESSS
jgi:LysR family hydrogen peroxide-inducible transcriptional activator